MAMPVSLVIVIFVVDQFNDRSVANAPSMPSPSVHPCPLLKHYAAQRYKLAIDSINRRNFKFAAALQVFLISFRSVTALL
jgi:hypothetical protein